MCHTQDYIDLEKREGGKTGKKVMGIYDKLEKWHETKKNTKKLCQENWIIEELTTLNE